MSTRPRRKSVLEEIAAEISAKQKEQQSNGGDDSKTSAPELEQPDVEIGSVETLRRNRLGRESRYPLLQTSVDEYTLDEERETCSASLPSIDTRISRSRLSFSPRTSSSPISFPSLSDFSSISSAQDRPASPRTTSYTSSAGRRSRRNTARSGSSSWSPASAFLSHWSKGEVPPPDPLDEGQEIGDNPKYIIGGQIGSGGFSVIKEVTTIEDGERIKRAVKIVRKHINGRTEQENETVQHNFEHEASIWRYLKHPYILPLIEVHETSHAIFCITQLNTGGTLHDFVRTLRNHNRLVSPSASNSPTTSTARSSSSLAKPTKRLPVLHLKKRYLYQLANALRFMHQDLGIVHRDIKLENCLLNLSPTLASSSSSTSFHSDASTSLSASITGNLLLCDFGMADFLSHDSRDPSPPRPSSSSTSTSSSSTSQKPTTTTTTAANIAGSLHYLSPECLSSPTPIYHTSIDIWAFGILAYTLLTLKLPFDHDLPPRLTAMIHAGEWDVDALREAVAKDAAAEENDEDVGEVVEGAVALVKGCLRKDVGERWDVERVLGCGFLCGCRELYDVEPGV